MAERFESLDDKHIEFIKQQHLFFISTAAADGTVNLSPKGMDCLQVINPNQAVWLNLTGSGNETAAHLLKVNRMTLMFCSFDRQPLILRLYGSANTIHPRDEKWASYLKLMPDFVGARQFFELNIDMVQTSCGYGVPYYEFKEDRRTLTKWAEKKGRSGVEAYWDEENQLSLDGFKTEII
ncbi:MAG: pyridoxamine 5'-phosphate oxidase family protein [Pseudomonadales bacterium]|jgi:hypothetical protein|nr:pyridoxamine 5'-phosphate oxidase family protein [Pseudomonadales bacterium]MDP6314677.1 pyridoxamine 5'-phosphate oxidase family protein [Pseudomonadales bacterium]MDP7313240.1 pyridoxamine 5'-phosphate oxidase family protein [Pseudomonadales bacterium]MDP7575706.1 pyridoxamine 5'-phosphate oxidase family protein [Pseudomonadales bacterium]HJP52281.1 pyridoxamine 5'-phosphate oxidase family protein [Pseudomonadales bacterium]|tara:strand:- start:3467 stop:4006 length:540 start_codon:yes stop_codon:yes gene_type:complete